MLIATALPLAVLAVAVVLMLGENPFTAKTHPTTLEAMEALETEEGAL